MNLSIEYQPPSRLNPAPYNPRRMDDESFERLKNGIKHFGLVDPIIARRADGLVIGGHQRLRACIALEWSAVPVILLDDLDDNKAAALNVLLNNPNAQGDWDMGKLAELLSTLDAEGFDATLTGFDVQQLENLMTWTPEDDPAGEGGGGATAPAARTIEVRVGDGRQAGAVADALRAYLAQHPEWDAAVDP